MNVALNLLEPSPLQHLAELRRNPGTTAARGSRRARVEVRPMNATGTGSAGTATAGHATIPQASGKGWHPQPHPVTVRSGDTAVAARRSLTIVRFLRGKPCMWMARDPATRLGSLLSGAYDHRHGLQPGDVDAGT